MESVIIGKNQEIDRLNLKINSLNKTNDDKDKRMRELEERYKTIINEKD